MLDHFGRGERTKLRGSAVVGAARKPDQETRREQVASAGGIDDALDWQRMNRVGLLARDNKAALLAAGHDAQADVGAQRIHGRVEVRRLIETVELALVGKDQVDRL